MFRTPWRRPALALVAGGALAISNPTPAAATRPALVAVEHADLLPVIADYRYRIIGKIRLLLFWVSGDNVGSARVSWSGDGDDRSAVSLLIGSDPGRAPRRINEWGYVREETDGESAAVFGIRTVTDGDSPEEADANRSRGGAPTEFGVLCARIDQQASESWTATIHADGDATYRHVGGVLETVNAHAHWTEHRTARPRGAAPGFLTALGGMMRAAAAAAYDRSTFRIPPTTYVYRDAVYDLSVRRSERVPQVRTRAALIEHAVRSEFTVTNRSSRSTTGFWITYGTDGPLAGVPLRAGYQPKWWFKIELELDDRIDAPGDPASDESTLQRMNALCER